VLGWFFHNLQQRVEALLRHHVGFVKNKNLVPVSGWSENRSFSQIARIIHTVMAGGVNLDDVKRACASSRQLQTARADTTRGIGGALVAVQAPGEDSSRGCFTASARTAKEISMIHTICRERMAERIGDVSLTD
jgi:tRNA(Ile2) C34 agmatinyltransferase TiaS